MLRMSMLLQILGDGAELGRCLNYGPSFEWINYSGLPKRVLWRTKDGRRAARSRGEAPRLPSVRCLRALIAWHCRERSRAGKEEWREGTEGGKEGGSKGGKEEWFGGAGSAIRGGEPPGFPWRAVPCRAGWRSATARRRPWRYGGSTSGRGGEAGGRRAVPWHSASDRQVKKKLRLLEPNLAICWWQPKCAGCIENSLKSHRECGLMKHAHQPLCRGRLLRVLPCTSCVG